MRTNWGVTILALSVAVAVGTVAAGAQSTGKVSIADHEGYMKSLSSTNGALAAKVKSNDMAGAAKDAQQLAAIFGNVERFWSQNSKADGVKWAQQGRQTATELAGALSKGDAEQVTALRKQMSSSCSSCHMTYREGSPQTGGYTIKAGVATP